MSLSSISSSDLAELRPSGPDRRPTVTPPQILWSLLILLVIGADAVFITVVFSRLATSPGLLISLFILLATQIAAVFVGVAVSTHSPTDDEDEIHRQGYAARRVWFLFITIFLIVVFVGTIPFFPYISNAAAHGSTKTVPVIAQQFMFLMPSQLPLEQRIVFEVTSRDVNHNFGIYDPKGELIAQVQAMPDYVNKLEVTFHERGRYTVRCLEFCGVGHAGMEKVFTVGGN